MRYFSTFSGIGGFEFGIGERGECIGYSEIDRYAIKIYESHFKHQGYGDITQIDERGLPDFDLLCGGFPCQSFSIAGKRGGFEDTRGTLFFHIARIAKYKRPRILFLENVKGLLSHDTGRTFNTIIATLDELGYDLQWQVLNSKNHGVPQNRERVFVIEHLRGTPRPEVFPFGENDGETSEIVQLNAPKHSNDRIYGESPLSPSLNTMQGGNRQPKIARAPLKFLDRNQKNVEGDYAFTVDSMNTGGVSIDSKIRRLTPMECERLQGFPDGWTEGISDSQRYKCLGNAVTVNVIRDIAERLL